jgi:hypothetical protein
MQMLKTEIKAQKNTRARVLEHVDSFIYKATPFKGIYIYIFPYHSLKGC